MTKLTLTVFGANGHIGQLLVAYALSEGYAVRAFVHTHNTLPQHPDLTIIAGDIYNESDVTNAIAGSDAVLSALSSWGTARKNVLTSAMEYIVPAMKSQGITRIISLTGAEARARGDDFSVIHRLAHGLIALIGGAVLRDGEAHIQVLEQSGLDWVVIRSPIMNARANDIYTVNMSRPLPWASVSRQAVASAMIAELAHEHHSQQALYIH